MKWIKITDKLPEDGIHVLIYDGDWIAFGYYQDGAWVDGTEKASGAITHWMELPTPPAKTKPQNENK